MENKGIEPRAEAPLIHGRMIYRCECCGKSWPMYLEKGIEEFGENHKPSPFMIECPYCGGWAMDVSGIQKIQGGGYVPLPEGGHYFANKENYLCGVPMFTVRSAGKLVAEDATAAIEDALARLKSREMEMCREAMREEPAHVEGMVNKIMPDEAEAIKETSVIVAKKTGVSVEEAVAMVLKVFQNFGNSSQMALAPFLGELDLEVFEAGEPLDVPSAWDRKEEREKRRGVERATASRFRQQKARENAWGAWKRTGQRRREWRGPWREN